MENRKSIYLFGALFSIAFAVLYFLIFNLSMDTNDLASKTIYFNQIGLYKNSENSDATIAKLQEENIIAVAIAKDDVTAVICGASESLAETKKIQDHLDTLGITYIEKNVVLEEEHLITLWNDQEIVKVLELIKY